MLKKVKYLLIMFLVYSCSCPDEEIAKSSFLLNLYLADNSSFYSAGYHFVKIQEYDKLIETDLNSYYLKLPIALNKSQSTFIIYGDSISDTIRISDYFVQPYFYNETYCGYQLKLTQPKVSYQTFSYYEILYFDSLNYSLNVEVYK